MVIGILKQPLLQQRETQTEARFVVVSIFDKRFAKLFFRGLIISSTKGFVSTLASLAVAARKHRCRHRQTDRKAGQKFYCHWGEPAFRVKSLHDFYLSAYGILP